MTATFAFSCQIFCDFSGYSTMARGLARMLGYDLPVNFLYPLLARNPIDYRRDWHVTMGAWFRDYLYRPLGGDRRGTARMVWNTMLTWMAFGLWHGASWTFIAWGLYNGLILAGYRLLLGAGLVSRAGRLATAFGTLSMPFFLSLALISFRSPDLATARLILMRILGWVPGTETIHPAWAAGLVALWGLHWLSRACYREGVLARVGWPARVALVTGMLGILLLFAGSGQPFYYFQF